MGDDIGEVIENAVLTSAKPEEQAGARALDMKCLTSFQGCSSLVS